MKSNGKSIVGGAGVTRPRRLLLCLDGVPLDLVRAARARGLFEGFGEPSRLLSPFPTLTNVALSEMLGASAPNGYESLYFDRKTKEMRGGISKYIGRRTPDKIPSSYMDDLDYQEPLPFEFLIYVAPEAVWRADMRRFHEKFRNAPQTRDFFAFLKGTDGLLHIRGPERLSVALESLDKILKEIQRYCGAETEIVLFSDHGMNLQENKRVHLQTHMKKRGYAFTDRLNGLKKDKSIAVPAFGLCGYAALYCAGEEAAAKIASDLATLEGVDFSIHRAGAHGVTVQSERGVARIEMRQNGHGLVYAYEQMTGDPLQLKPFVKALAEAGELDEQGYASDAAWYAQTASHIYPDALSNLFNSLHTPRVRHNADVLVSMQDGYYFGASIFSRFVRLAATHGNALRASTSAFLMSTHRALPETVRASEAQPLLR